VKSRQAFRELLYRLRTEGGSPGRIAAAVGLGIFIGCSPLYGFHLLFCFVFAKLFRLNRALTYLASHISLPGLLPFIFVLEVQIARWMRGAPLLSFHLRTFTRTRQPELDWHLFLHWHQLLRWLRHLNWHLLTDALLGSIPLGLVLAVAFAVPTYRIALRRSREPERNALIEETAYRYLGTGMIHWEVVRGKLRHDPVYFHLLRPGALPGASPLHPAGRLLDLGCGRGILFSLLLTARAQAERGAYPLAWGPPPRHLSFHGIEGRPKTADAARHALGSEAHIETADLRTAPLPAADTVLLLDVLHYLPAGAQEDLLARIAAVLSAGGHLLIRDADASAGWRFTATRLQERFSALARRHWRQRFHYRGRAEWTGLLEALGFEVIDKPMGQGTPYANVLLTARRV
jgi:uncharacterized protein (DUF2062 family)/SAM-dependent methyltransferase